MLVSRLHIDTLHASSLIITRGSNTRTGKASSPKSRPVSVHIVDSFIEGTVILSANLMSILFIHVLSTHSKEAHTREVVITLGRLIVGGYFEEKVL